jgi:hypothetical protein
MMCEGNTLLHERRFEATEKAQKVALLETMIIDFKIMAASLAQEIAAEETRTRIKDTGHVAYSTLAKAVALRRSNLLASVTDLTSKLDVAKRELDEVTIQLRDLEVAQSSAPSIRTIATSEKGQSSKPRPVTAGPTTEAISIENPSPIRDLP